MPHADHQYARCQRHAKKACNQILQRQESTAIVSVSTFTSGCCWSTGSPGSVRGSRCSQRICPHLSKSTRSVLNKVQQYSSTTLYARHKASDHHPSKQNEAKRATTKTHMLDVRSMFLSVSIALSQSTPATNNVDRPATVNQQPTCSPNL